MNILETLKDTVNDADLLDSKLSDKEVIELLKLNLCFRTDDESYETWKKAGWIKTIEVDNGARVKVLGLVKDRRSKEKLDRVFKEMAFEEVIFKEMDEVGV